MSRYEAHTAKWGIKSKKEETAARGAEQEQRVSTEVPQKLCYWRCLQGDCSCRSSEFISTGSTDEESTAPLSESVPVVESIETCSAASNSDPEPAPQEPNNPRSARSDSLTRADEALLVATDEEPGREDIESIELETDRDDDFSSVSVNDIGRWPDHISDSFRVSVVETGPAAIQHIDSDFATVVRAGDSARGTERRLTKDWFFRRLSNKEKVLRVWMMYSPAKGALLQTFQRREVYRIRIQLGSGLQQMVEAQSQVGGARILPSPHRSFHPMEEFGDETL